MPQYRYIGRVMRFDTCIQTRYEASTTAPNEARARSNLEYRYKRENKLAPGAKIVLPDKLRMI